MAGDEFYDDEVTSGPTDEERACPYCGCACPYCGSTTTHEVCRDDVCINVCAECGSDEP